MNTIFEILFWVCAAGVLYAYIFYPALIFMLSKVFGRDRIAADLDDDALPNVSLLIAAHNEEDVIHDRILNALALDYPADRLDIVIASDGSSDRTVQIAKAFGERVRLLDYPTRRGKSSTLNAAMNEVRGEIVLLSDANTSVDPAAILKLVRWFVDPQIGVVCGRLEIVDPQTGLNVDGAYWKFETFLKRCENRLGALLGSNGAIYAIRKSHFEPIPCNTIVDDFVIPLCAKIRTGCEVIYDSQARGVEDAAPMLKDEFRRRIRIGAGGFQAIGMLLPLLSPRFGWTTFAFISHKICRWLCPMFMLTALILSTWLATESVEYGWILAAQFGFYVTALLAMLVPGSSSLMRPLRLASMFVSMNLALFLGFIRFARGSQKGIWQRTQRITPGC